MSTKIHDRIAELIDQDTESEEIAWDKGTPRYKVVSGPKTFYVRNLNEWCAFYEVNYQMLCRKMREAEGQGIDAGVYNGLEVTKLVV